MSSKEFVSRLMSKGRKYQAQLEERRLLQQLLAGLEAGEQSSFQQFKRLLEVCFWSFSSCQCCCEALLRAVPGS